jgi:hypothetical protein
MYNQLHDQIEPANKSSLALATSDLVTDRNERLPVWVRAPKSGNEYFTGLSRAKLYELATRGKIRSHSLREPGQIKGTRLFHLQSILDHIEKGEKATCRKGGK